MSETRAHLVTGFQRVDETGEAERFIQCLDSVRSMQSALVWKQQSFELLGLRPGMHVLDLGCGTGDDARAIAEIVGPTGRVLGIDISETMLEEASKRVHGTGLPIEFALGNAEALDVASASFDACRTERLFVHVPDPALALAEMIRILRPGGRIAVTEPDMETWIVNAPDRALTRRIMNCLCDNFADGWAGRKLSGLFAAAGLSDPVVHPAAAVFTDYARAELVMSLQTASAHAVAGGAISEDERAAWLASIEAEDRRGAYFGSVTIFTVAAQKPSA